MLKRILNKIKYSSKKAGKFKESELAHTYLDGLHGYEIGGSAHNSFGLSTKNIDITDITNTQYKKAELEVCGEQLKVDIVSPGDDLPFKDDSVDFILSSHVLEHFYDPIKALKEWYRVIRPGGYIFAIIPHKERTFDKDRERTTLEELIERHNEEDNKKVTEVIGSEIIDHHFSVWITEDLIQLIKYLEWDIVDYQDIDDKVGNGFTIVIKINK